jgi:hypothetical protein
MNMIPGSRLVILAMALVFAGTVVAQEPITPTGTL